MNFQVEWEKEHTIKEWGKYPNENVIKFVARNYFKEKNRGEIKILDAGCGVGAQSWFLVREGFDVYGFDFSKSAIEKLKYRFEKEKLCLDGLDKFEVKDAIKLDYPDGFFDAVVDSSMLPCLDDESIVKVLKQYYRILNDKPYSKLFCGGLHEIGGVFGLETGKKAGGFMVGEMKEGRLAGNFYNNFFDRERIYLLFGEAGFDSIKIDYFTEEFDDKNLDYRYFNIIAAK